MKVSGIVKETIFTTWNRRHKSAKRIARTKGFTTTHLANAIYTSTQKFLNRHFVIILVFLISPSYTRSSDFSFSNWESGEILASVNFILGLDLRTYKVEKILKGSLDSIPSPTPSVRIQIMSGKVFLRCKGKTLLICQQTFYFQKFIDLTQQCFDLLPQVNFPPPIIWIFTEGKGDGIESRLSSKVFSTLPIHTYVKFFEISKFRKLSTHFRWLCFSSFQRKWRGYKFWHLLSYAFWIDSHPSFWIWSRTPVSSQDFSFRAFIHMPYILHGW